MSIGKVKEFDIKSGVWSSYVERLEMYFTDNNVKSDLKLPTLIAVMGDEAYELLVNLSSPKKPSELKYEDAIELLRRHLQPAPSVLAERFRFRQRRQAADENIASYVAELKKLTRHCKLGNNLNENLRDQFVCGLRSDLIRQRLFAEEETISFANAVKLANSLEAAERDAAAVDTAGAAEETRPFTPRNHHNWGARFGRRREELKYKEPTTLAEMEELAWKSTLLMEKHAGKSEHHFHTAMDLLRQQYNMNFIMICEKCNSPHVYDEVTAPER